MAGSELDRPNRLHEVSNPSPALQLVERLEDDAIFILDEAGRIVWWNKGAELLQGWRADEVLGRHCSLLYPPASVAQGRPEHLLDLARKQGRYVGEELQLRRDGNEYLAQISLYVLCDDAGRVTGFGEVARDVTELSQAQSVLRNQEAHLRSILESAPDALVVIDESGRIRSFSAMAERLFGYTASDVAGCNVSMLAASPHREAHDSYLARYLATGEKRIIGLGRVVAGRKRDGSIFPMELAVGEAINDGGERLFTGFIRDISSRQELERRLQDIQAELIHVARVSAAGTMASALAHELNQPLTAVANFVMAARALLRSDRSEDHAEAHAALAEAAEQAVRAGQIVRRLREFVARGEVEREPIGLGKLIEESAALALAGTRQHGVRMEVDLDPTVSRVFADRIQIQQVLLNLIRNAIEAMDGCERRELIISAAARNSEEVELSVVDTGPGLPADIAERLFEPFVSSKAGGLGVGLSICRTIVEAHEGRLWAEALDEGGSAFRFTLPRADNLEEENV